jgi:hypothetical protein
MQPGQRERLKGIRGHRPHCMILDEVDDYVGQFDLRPELADLPEPEEEDDGIS